MHVFLIAAITEDGFIAQDPTVPSTHWTSKADKQFFSQRTKEAGVIVMGRKTYETIGRPLGGRVNIVFSRQSSVVSSIGRGAEEQSRAEKKSTKFEIRNSKEETKNQNIHDSRFIIHDLFRELHDEKIHYPQFTIYDLSKDAVYLSSLHPTRLTSLLQENGCKELAVCGGASVYKQFFDAGLLDTLYLTVHPVKFGKGIPLFGGETFHFSELEKTYKKVEEMQLDEEGTKLIVFRRQ